ncbi:unnamed protein product [Acanthoscelides obtectus]|uniref:Uncharacterized protein n=1 Tax=Acanthoscelides obtectus TaxID=200917 RepID=A0A9P0Q024_ACAOB|nr:unnamed protein product [Acanthoscelides obtectus]CAK1649418.1 hypothetical protein AOBTE_LOCUS16225 [Acanthoscelides obtectus]
MFVKNFVLWFVILVASAQNYPPLLPAGYTPYGYGYPFYRQPSASYYQPQIHQQYGAGIPDTYENNQPVDIIDVNPDVFREEMRKLGILPESTQGNFNNIQHQFNYADYQIPLNNPHFSYPPFAVGPQQYQPIQYAQTAPAQFYPDAPPYGISELSNIPQMAYAPFNVSTENIQAPDQPSAPYTQSAYQVPAQIPQMPPIGHLQSEFTYIPTYQNKNQSPSPFAKKRRHRHRYVIKKDSSQNNGNQSESRLIDKHEIQRKTYTFQKTFVVTPEKRPSGPITINLVNGIPVTEPQEMTTTVPTTTTTEDNEVPEDTTGFVNPFSLK